MIFFFLASSIEFFFFLIFATKKELGLFAHPCQDMLVCKANREEVPYFNAPVYLQNKTRIGKIDEILGPYNEFVC